MWLLCKVLFTRTVFFSLHHRTESSRSFATNTCRVPEAVWRITALKMSIKINKGAGSSCCFVSLFLFLGLHKKKRRFLFIQFISMRIFPVA